LNQETNTQLVKQAYHYIAAGDMPSFLNLLAEDVAWMAPNMPNVPFAGTWHGREGVAEFFRRVTETQDVVEFLPEEFIAQGDRIAVLGHFTMHVKSTGKPSRSHWAHIWKIKEGRVSYMREYVDTLTVSQAHSP
jgi:ketosteroid isomerase-like protein